MQDVQDKVRILGHDLLSALPVFFAIVLVFVTARFVHRLINQFLKAITESGLTSATFDHVAALCGRST